jgi:hypothetical protein
VTSQRYKRAVSVTVANLLPGTFKPDTPNAFVITGLHVAFTVEKSLGATPNTCTISISNLAADTRARLQKLPLNVTLAAGYEGEIRQLFVGDVVYTSTQRDGGTVVTKIQVGDGSRAYSSARFVRSYKGAVNAKQVIGDLAGAMGLSLPSSSANAQGLLQSFASGVSISGPGAREVDRIVKAHGLDWSIQDGQMQILAPGDVRPGSAILVSQDTGMIGSPEYGAPSADGKPPTLTVASLLLPEATPGGTIQVQSIGTNGVFRIEKAKHEGDTHGEPWTTTMEVVAR